MVKAKRPREVCLDPFEPIYTISNDRDQYEQVTLPDISPSLYQMVTTGTVGSMQGNTQLYQFPDLGDDDEAHDHPDYMKLDKLDIVEKEQFINNFIENPNNYEKKVVSEETPAEGQGGQSEGEKPEQKA